MLLAGDIGGTKVNLALFDSENGRLFRRSMQTFHSHEHDGLSSILTAFLGAAPPPLRAATFGVAGPVVQGCGRITNLPWSVDTQHLRQLLGIERIRVVNDLEATAYGVLTLDDDDLLVLNQGSPSDGTIAVIAAGTGLGEGYLIWDGRQHYAAPSEGGHADFAPRTDLEADLLVYLRRRFGHVSYERVLSGPGLVNIYEFLRDTGRAEEPAELARQVRDGDPAAVIAEAALQGAPRLCVQALDMFAAIYGAEAGNLALKVLATGGVYVCGGIAPKIRGKLADGTLLAAFRDKGRMAFLMDKMAVRVVLNEQTALNGAAYCAARLAQKEERQ
jgi:glucokinase